MSYILEALKRADAERERDSSGVPGLHAQPVPLPVGAPVAARPRWAWGAAAAAVVVAGGVGWLALRREAAPPAPAAAADRLPPPPAPEMAQTPPPAPSAAAPVPAPPPATAIAPRPAPPPIPRMPPPAAAPGAARMPPPPPRERALSTAPDPARVAAPPADAAPRSTELPEELRRQLPPLMVGGSIYSPLPAGRILILNGQPLHEKDLVAPDLVLEEIRPKSATLSYKGRRFDLNY